MSTIRQNISSAKLISRVFPWKFLQIQITSVSGCLRSHSKFAKQLQAQVCFDDFTIFFNLVFGGFLRFSPTVRQVFRHCRSQVGIGTLQQCSKEAVAVAAGPNASRGCCSRRYYCGIGPYCLLLATPLHPPCYEGHYCARGHCRGCRGFYSSCQLRTLCAVLSPTQKYIYIR